jgi:hypothetical protein
MARSHLFEAIGDYIEEPDLTGAAGKGRKTVRERGYPELSVYRHELS